MKLKDGLKKMNSVLSDNNDDNDDEDDNDDDNEN